MELRWAGAALLPPGRAGRSPCRWPAEWMGGSVAHAAMGGRTEGPAATADAAATAGRHEAAGDLRALSAVLAAVIWSSRVFKCGLRAARPDATRSGPVAGGGEQRPGRHGICGSLWVLGRPDAGSLAPVPSACAPCGRQDAGRGPLPDDPPVRRRRGARTLVTQSSLMTKTGLHCKRHRLPPIRDRRDRSGRALRASLTRAS